MPIIASNSQESSESQESEMIPVIVDTGKLKPGSVQQLFEESQLLEDWVEPSLWPSILIVNQGKQPCLPGICLGPEISHNPINKLSKMEGQLPISSPPSPVVGSKSLEREEKPPPCFSLLGNQGSRN